MENSQTTDNLEDKIIQIIPVPENMPKLAFSYEDDDGTYNNYDPDDCYEDDAVCLALMENQGERYVVPMIWDDIGYSIIPATDLGNYHGESFKSSDDDDCTGFTEIIAQNGMGDFFAPKNTSCYIEKSDNDGEDFSIYLIISGKSVCVGKFNTEQSAKAILDNISNSIKNNKSEYRVHSQHEIDVMINEEKLQQEHRAAYEIFKKSIFSESQAYTLSEAGYKTLDEVKNTTVEEMNARGITNKNSIKYLLPRIEKLRTSDGQTDET